MKIAVDIVNPETSRKVKTATATPTGIKIGTRVQPVGVVFGLIGEKGKIRALRKKLREAGFSGHAAAPVCR
jgi:hypothetical protein